MAAAAHLLTVLLLICSATLAFGHASLRQAGEAESSTSSIGPKLPVFFFHGLSSDVSSGAHFQTNLTANGRAFTALTFCQSQCSSKALYLQVQDAIAQIQGIVSGTLAIYKDGYIFMGFSQGALIARVVVEEWDNYNADYLALAVLSVYGPKTVDKSVFDFSKFSPADYNGKMQRAAAEATLCLLQALGRHEPVPGNSEQRQRLRLQERRVPQSPEETLFTRLRVLDVKQTSEYKQDSYELQTLDKRGRLFLHAVPNVGHSCWARDYVTADGGLNCKFQPVYDAHIYPVLHDPLHKSIPQ